MSDAIRAVTTGRVIPLPGNDIDTDRIIPARYLKAITFDGLGEGAFIDERAAERDAGRTHPFDDARWAGGSILLVGRNFGCGSSREHAPQALQRFGIRALVGESFAEIFSGNCTVLGIPAVRAAGADIERLQALVQQDPALEVTVDLEAQTVTAGDLQCPATLPEGARHALVRGTWDSTTLLLAGRNQIAATAARLPYLNAFAG
jgi:3-isopropylmalate/(R)-2-methylmalate dehydratase small subunit